MSSKRSSSFRRAIANGRRTLQREILLDETGLGLYKRFVRYVAYEILPCETDRRWYFHQNRLCPPPVFIAVVTIIQVRFGKEIRCWRMCCWARSWFETFHRSLVTEKQSKLKPSEPQLEQLNKWNLSLVSTCCDLLTPERQPTSDLCPPRRLFQVLHVVPHTQWSSA